MGKRILVVDDEWAVLELVRAKLSKKGFEVLTARNVKECWDQAFSKKPDLLILDIWLNNGHVGTKVYDEMVSAGFDSEVPVIFISALLDEGKPPKRAPIGGKFALFGKPFDFDLMFDEIRRFLGSPTATAPGKRKDLGGWKRKLHRPERLEDSVKSNLMAVIKESGDTMNSAAEVIGEAVNQVVHNQSAAPLFRMETISEIVKNAASGVIESGGNLEEAAQGTLFGVLRASHDTGISPHEMVEVVVQSFIQTASELHGDLAQTARGLVKGAVDGAAEIEANADEAASDTANAALKASYQISTEAGETVHTAVNQPFSNARIFLREPFRSQRQ